MWTRNVGLSNMMEFHKIPFINETFLLIGTIFYTSLQNVLLSENIPLSENLLLKTFLGRVADLYASLCKFFTWIFKDSIDAKLCVSSIYH